MTTILHVIQQLSLGGAARALIATSKYSSKSGNFRHRALSLAPADPDGRALAHEAGVDVVENPTADIVKREMAQADIVQVHWWNNAVLQTVLHWDLPPMRLIMWYHVAGHAVPQVITSDLVRMADLNVATNPFTFHELPVFRFMPPSERSKRVAMIYDPADFARLEGLQSRAHDGFNVGYIGTVDTFKMHPNFVSMSAGIQIPNARFIVCGGGMESELQREAERLGAAERFEFRGYVKDIRPVLETLDVFGYPLCENTYASGELTLQEAMYAGIPTVAFPYGGLKRLLIHEYTGLLVETEKDYQQAVEHLFHHPDERRRMGRNARQFAMEIYGAENAAQNLNPLYERLMMTPKRSRSWGQIPNHRAPLEQAGSPSGVLQGHQLFVESLGGQASEFGISLENEDLAQLLCADDKISRAPRLVQHTGIFAYRIGYPNDPWLAFWAGLGSLHTGDGQTALHDFGLAIKEGFVHWRIYWHLARAATQVGERQLALEALHRFLKMAPDFAHAHALLAELTGRSITPPLSKESGLSSKPDCAEEFHSPSSALLPPQVRELSDEAMRLWEANKLSEARDKLLKALTMAPTDSDILLALGSLEIQLGELEVAWTRIQAVASRSVQDDAVQVLFAQLSLQLNKRSDFERTLAKIIRRSPDHPGALRLQAQDQFWQGRYADAARTCLKALAHNENEVTTLTLLAHSLREAGDPDSARLTWEKIQTIEPENSEAKTHLESSLRTPKITVHSLSLDNSLDPSPPTSDSQLASSNLLPGQIPGAEQEDSDRPLVSVLVSTYNAAQCLPACLEDLLRQTIADRCEIIVIDSGSEQEEGRIVEEFQKRHNNIRYLRTERESLYAAWNRGLEMAQGIFITNANTDDAHFPDALEKQVAALRAYPEADLAYCDSIDTWVPNDSFKNPKIIRTIRYPRFEPALAMFYCPLACHPMWRATVFQKLGAFDASYQGPGDYEFFLRFVKAGLKSVHVPESLSLFYKNPDGISFQSVDRSRIENDRVLQKYRSEIPIEKLFRVAPGNAEQTALAWTALGNMAMCHEVPWFDNPQQDLHYAKDCYTQALRCDAKCEPALRNRILLLALAGDTETALNLIENLPPEKALEMRRKLDSGDLQIVPVEVPPAATHFRFQSDRHFEFESNLSIDETAKAVETAQPVASMAIRWIAPFSNGTDFAVEARQVISSTVAELWLGAFDQSDPYSDSVAGTCSKASIRKIEMAKRRLPFMSGGVAVIHQPAPNFAHIRNADYHIGYTWSEADGIPTDWVTSCNRMDEVWVPSEFHREVFEQSGVSAHKLHVVAGITDPARFNPKTTNPLSIDTEASFHFLAIFEWSARAGWDVLLKSYIEEFSSSDDVCLILRTWLPGKVEDDSGSVIVDRFQQFLKQMGYRESELPKIKFLTAPMHQTEEPSLYRLGDCLVNPSRGEGSGRVLREAMMMELPIVATGWGGFREHLQEEHAMLIECELEPVHTTDLHLWACRRHRWAAPSGSHLRQLLRQALNAPDRLKAKGVKARAYAIKHFSPESFSQSLTQRLEILQQNQESFQCPIAKTRVPSIESDEEIITPSISLNVAWEGTFLDLGSLSHVNRELSTSLSKQDGFNVTRIGKNNVPKTTIHRADLKKLAATLAASADDSTDVIIRHAWPPDWSKPTKGAWVMIQPWEYGVIPEEWIHQLKKVDEIWVPSNFVRQCYIDSGVSPEKVQVVPNGIDPERFHTQANPMALATSKSYKFLFVGGTIHRKGPDILLDAYLANFTAQDDVCLVIKDFGSQSIYAGQTLEKRIKSIQTDPTAPEILYLTEELSDDELPSLYTACNCLVHPYRGEGFGLPILEAMACGLPVLITGGGAADDFATDEFAYRIPAKKTSIGTEISGLRLVHAGWLLEPSREHLAEKLNWIFQNSAQARALGTNASQHVRAHWTWDKASQVASLKLKSLLHRKRAHALQIHQRRIRNSPSIELPKTALLGRLQEARESLRRKELKLAWTQTIKALSERPFHPEAYLLLAQVAEKCGDITLARTCATQAKHMVPGWKNARRFLKSLKGVKSFTKLKPDVLPVALLETKASQVPKLSVCLITRNEEQFIGNCLASVQDVAHQIVVLDTGSTDWTCAIAARFGAEIHKLDWNDDFSEARNAALEYARGDWILMIDADEELKPESKSKLREELSREDTMAWRLPIFDRGKEREGCNHVPRLFRNAPGLFYVGRIHEQVFSSLEVLRESWGLQNNIGEAILLHHGYSGQVTRDRMKIARNLYILERAMEELPNEPSLLMNHGLELVRSGQLNEGLAQYWEAFHILSFRPSKERVPELVETLLTQLSSHLLSQRDFESTIQILTSPLALDFDLTASLHFTMGLAYMEVREYRAAIKHFEACLAKRGQRELTIINPQITGIAPRHCLAICHWKLEQFEQAEQIFAQCTTEAPTSTLPKHDFALFLADRHQLIDSLKLLHELTVLNPNDTKAWIRGGQVALSRPDLKDFACDWTNESIKLFPADRVIVEQRAEGLLLLGKYEESLQLWRRISSINNARVLAAQAVVQLILEGTANVPSALEPAISREFVNWYQRLIHYAEDSTIYKLNEILSRIATFLPSAYQCLQTAIQEATNEAAM